MTGTDGTTPGSNGAVRARAAARCGVRLAAVVAFGVIVGFALFGRSVPSYLGVQLPALQGAGGLLLLLVWLELLTGKAAEPTGQERRP